MTNQNGISSTGNFSTLCRAKTTCNWTQVGTRPRIQGPVPQLQVKNITQLQTTDSTANTKRKVLATTAFIFDPLGILSPAVISYKIFLHKLWQDKLQQDEVLPVHLEQEWNQLHQTIPNLSQIKINRKVVCSNATNIQIHGFCDGSERAYGACLYIRSKDNWQNILWTFVPLQRLPH